MRDNIFELVVGHQALDAGLLSAERTLWVLLEALVDGLLLEGVPTLGNRHRLTHYL